MLKELTKLKQHNNLIFLTTEKNKTKQMYKVKPVIKLEKKVLKLKLDLPINEALKCQKHFRIESDRKEMTLSTT